MIFGFGLACVMTILAWFLYLSHKQPLQGAALLGVVTTHLTTGRAVGIAAALGGNFAKWQAIVLGSLIEGAVVCLFFPVFCLSFKRLITVRFLTDAMRTVHRSAVSQRGRLLKWGIPGLILFVWFPFFMTGPVVGSVIGFLLGMRPWVVAAVVLSGTSLAIVSWTFILREVLGWTRMIGEFLPMLVVCIIVIVVASVRVSRFIEAQQRRNGAKRADERSPDAPPQAADDQAQPVAPVPAAGDVS